MSVVMTPYASAAWRNCEIFSICLKAICVSWIFLMGSLPRGYRLLMSLQRIWSTGSDADLKLFRHSEARFRKKRFSGVTHRSIHEPFLEVLLSCLGSFQISSTLSDDPVDQPSLQIRVVLLFDFLLYFPAQAIAGASVCHDHRLFWITPKKVAWGNLSDLSVAELQKNIRHSFTRQSAIQ